MSTEQSYVGRGNYANTHPQTAEKAPQSALNEVQPSPPPSFDPCDPEVTLKYLTNELVQTCQDFSEFKNPTTHLIDLIRHWTYSKQDFNAEENRRALRQVLSVISFINEARRLSDQIEYFTDEVKQKEVANGNA